MQLQFYKTITVPLLLNGSEVWVIQVKDTTFNLDHSRDVQEWKALEMMKY